MPTSNSIEAAKAVLKAAGYVVHKDKSWRKLLERVRVAECLRQAAEEYRESTQRWAETTLHNEIRDLQARCTFLYGMARAKGASAAELSGGWTVTGVNIPTEVATIMKCHCGIHPFIIQADRASHLFLCPIHGDVKRAPTPGSAAQVGLDLLNRSIRTMTRGGRL